MDTRGMEQIGRYQIVGELGRGAMGVVYRAQDPTIGRTIAIKTIRLSDLTDTGERQRLRDRLVREAQSAGILSHPGIVTIYDIQEEADMAYIFMEFVDGAPLEKTLLAEQAIDKTALVSILKQTAAALDYAHKKGIIHRDIKPANIMIDGDGAAKIADFGVAKIVSQQMTQVGAMMGTPTYMSPEQVQSKTVDGRADQFSLAVIAYELLTGEKPFVSDYLPTLLYKIVSEEPIAPQRINPSLGQQVEQVFRKAMAKDPAARYETCTDFVNALVIACESKKNWQPLPRGSSQSLPTVATTGGAIAEAAGALQQTPVLPRARKPHRATSDEPAKSSGTGRAVRTILAFCAPVILVGLLFLGWQKFQGSEAERTAENAPPKVEPEKPAPAEVRKPSPVSPAKEAAPLAKPPAAQEELPPSAPATESKPPQAAPRTPARVKQAASGEEVVDFISSPPGATLNFDGNPQLTCKTPCSFALPKGRHTLTASAAGHRSALKIFETSSAAPVAVSLEVMAGTLAVKSTPGGATIVVDGTERPEKTPALLKLPVGTHRVKLIKEGLPPYEEEVAVKDNGFHDMNISWK